MLSRSSLLLLLFTLVCFVSTAQAQDVSESEHVNIFTKLKDAITSAGIGILLLIFIPIGVFLNEGRHVRELKRILYISKHAVEVNDKTMKTRAGAKTNVGDAVFFTSTVTTDGEILEFDADGSGDLFHAIKTQNSIALKRKCEIYQWKESSTTTKKKDKMGGLGGGETRTKTWKAEKQWCSEPQTLEHCKTGNQFNTSTLWETLRSSTASDLNVIIIAKNGRSGCFALTQELLQDEFVGPFDWAPIAASSMPKISVQLGSTHEFIRKGAPNTLQSEPKPTPPSAYGTVPTLVSQAGGGIPIGTVRVTFEHVPDMFDASFAASVQPIGGRSSWGDDEDFDVEDPHESTPLKKSGTITPTSKSGAQGGGGGSTTAKTMSLGMIECHDEAWLCPVSDDKMGEEWLISRGTLTLKQLAGKKRAAENCMTWIIRAVGTALLILGWSLLLSPIATLFEVLPYIGGIGSAVAFIVAIIFGLLCFCVTCGVAYISYRPILVTGGLLLALSIITWILIDVLKHNDEDAVSGAHHHLHGGSMQHDLGSGVTVHH